MVCINISHTTLLQYAVFCALCSYFASKVATSFLKLQKEKIGVAKRGIRHKYIEFPSISICLEEKASLGFDSMRPLNEIFDKVKYTRHYENG